MHFVCSTLHIYEAPGVSSSYWVQTGDLSCDSSRDSSRDSSSDSSNDSDDTGAPGRLRLCATASSTCLINFTFNQPVTYLGMIF